MILCRRFILRRFAFVAAALLALAAPAHAQAVIWDLINEYPATSLTGEGDIFFAQAVKEQTNGRVVIRPIAEAASGLRSREHLKAVADGRFAMASSFGGSLGQQSPVFLLSSLPFITASPKEARALLTQAQPLYEKLFAAHEQKLLYVSPWPASGLWSAVPADGVATLKTLKIRTYDPTGTEVFARVAASAAVISFADLTPKLESGEINAVLSSGDGGAGRQLWKHLRNFSDILYAVPLSFTTVSLKAWNALDAKTQAAVLEAAKETTDRQWDTLANRTDQNFARMRANGVTIDEHPPAAVMDALRNAAQDSVSAWEAAAGPEAKALLDNYRAGKKP
jgi:TRAP-type C4-dicarboxylate transport system substrate-binding protein